MSEIDERLAREMALVSAFLYGSGAALVMVTLALPHWEELATAPILVLVAVAICGAAAHLSVARWWRAPLVWFSVWTAAGSVLIASVAVAGGPAAASTYGILYVYVAAFAFYYFPVRLAVVHVVFAAVTFAVALAILGHHAAPAEWAVVVGAAVAAGGIIGGLGKRAREHYLSEQRAAERLREIDAMKTLFLQAVSHELRTPLTAVKGAAEVLLEHDERLDASVRSQMMERMVVNSTRLGRLLSDLLDVNRLAQGSVELVREPVWIDAVVQEVVRDLDEGGERVRVHSEPVRIEVDVAKFERIVESLVGNALKHTPPGTRIEVSVRRMDDQALVVVDDEGPGIPDAEKADVFVPLRQGSDSIDLPQPGVGLGLALTSRYVEMHGGRIWIEDRPTGGSRVCVALRDVDQPEGSGQQGPLRNQEGREGVEPS